MAPSKSPLDHVCSSCRGAAALFEKPRPGHSFGTAAPPAIPPAAQRSHAIESAAQSTAMVWKPSDQGCLLPCCVRVMFFWLRGSAGGGGGGEAGGGGNVFCLQASAGSACTRTTCPGKRRALYHMCCLAQTHPMPTS